VEAEQRLVDLGYWNGEIDGVLDGAFRHALIAFQKIEGRPRTGRLTSDEIAALQAATRPQPRVSGRDHIEIDLRRQVLFLVDSNGQVSHILPVCTGNDKYYSERGQRGIARTPRGTFKVQRKIKGWRISPLGLLYYPCYFHGGFAIHGSLSVLTYPASHGCVRIPMFASKKFSELTPVGIEVVVYDS
jgi:lipoprotein-anchoring transpeptidase ErfK/SrfK